MLVLLFTLVLNSLITVLVGKSALKNGMSVYKWSAAAFLVGVFCVPLFVVHKKLAQYQARASLAKSAASWIA